MMFSAHALEHGDRFIPADKAGSFGNDEHYVFIKWDRGEAIGRINTAPKLAPFVLPIKADTNVLLARPRHRELPAYSI